MDVARFAQLGVATTLEAAGGTGLVRAPLLRLVPGTCAAGPARTALCGEGDNLALHRLLACVEPGEVVVAVRPCVDEIAFAGELMALQAKASGAAAMLVDGAVRDLDRIAEIGLPVWARAVSALGPEKVAAGALDVPVQVGGVTIAPGDLVVLDADGAVVVPATCARDVLAQAEARDEQERALRSRIGAGEATLDLLGLRSHDV